MKNNRLLVGGAVLVVLLGITALLVKNRNSNDTGTAAPAVTIAAVDKAAVDSLELRRANGDTVTLRKVDGTWRVAAPVDALADQANVGTALDKLAEITVSGVAATSAANHARLEVDEAHGVHVVAKQGATVLADLWIGAYRGGHSMVRKQGDNAVAMVDGSIRYAFDRATKDWRHRLVVEVAASDIGEVRFQSTNGTYAFRKNGTEWALAEGQAPIERFAPSRVASLVSSIARVRATDFAEANVTAEEAGLGENAAVIRFATSGDGGTQEVVLRLGIQKPGGNAEYYLSREGDPVIYVVTSFLAGKLQPNVDAFQSPADGGVAPPEDEPPGMPGMPGIPGMGGPGGPMGGPGGGQIPPELLQQLQRQLQQQQGAQ